MHLHGLPDPRKLDRQHQSHITLNRLLYEPESNVVRVSSAYGSMTPGHRHDVILHDALVDEVPLRSIAAAALDVPPSNQRFWSVASGHLHRGGCLFNAPSRCR
jgi:hypothetical protein